MPRTPPTIVAPLPSDPRVMSLGKATSITTREAFACAAEAWAWMSVMAVDDIVAASVDSLDSVVGVNGFGAAMLQAGLVGAVDDGLVLPAELRRHERDERGGAAAPADQGDAYGKSEQDRRRKEQNAAAARRYRKKNRVMGSKAKSSSDKAWRSLGHVAGHEVRVFDGPYGCYAMVLGATVGGRPYRKLTAGEKSWSLETVRLVDALPALVEKWKEVCQKESRRPNPLPTVPFYVDFRDDAERLTALAKLQATEADAARHADGADASPRHADASAASAGPSADQDADDEQKSFGDKGLDASSASADRHADAFSSMSCLSKSSSSHEEEDMGPGGREAADDHERDQGNAEPVGMTAWDQKRRRQRTLAEKFSVVLGEDVETILHRWKQNPVYLRLQLEAKGIDPNTGDIVNAEAPGKPSRTRADMLVTTEPAEDDKPADGSVGARDGDEPDEDFEVTRHRLVEQLRKTALTATADVCAGHGL